MELSFLNTILPDINGCDQYWYNAKAILLNAQYIYLQ